MVSYLFTYFFAVPFCTVGTCNLKRPPWCVVLVLDVGVWQPWCALHSGWIQKATEMF